MMLPTDCPAYIAAGGKSRRFGSDKACVEVQGETLLPALVRQCRELGHSTQVVSDQAERYEAFDLNSLVDVARDSGPAAALWTALLDRSKSGGGWLLFLACDQVCWKSHWWEELSVEANGELDAVCFNGEVDGRRFFQPIPGLYHTKMIPELERALKEGQRSLRVLLEDLQVVGISSKDNPSDWSFNTPEELVEVCNRLAST